MRFVLFIFFFGKDCSSIETLSCEGFGRKLSDPEVGELLTLLSRSVGIVMVLSRLDKRK